MDVESKDKFQILVFYSTGKELREMTKKLKENNIPYITENFLYRDVWGRSRGSLKLLIKNQDLEKHKDLITRHYSEKNSFFSILMSRLKEDFTMLKETIGNFFS